MNALIIWIAEIGQSEQVRAACISIGAIMLILSGWWYAPKIGVTKKKMLLALLLAYPVLLGVLEIMGAVEGYLAANRILGIQVVTNSGIKLFVILPFLCQGLSKLLKIELRKLFDLFAVMQIAEYPICTLGCLFTGCCRGYLCSWGVYSPITEDYYFPVQIINAIIMCVILAVLVFRSRKRQYIADGKLLPIMLILFGVTRIITEFFMDIEKPILGLTVVAVYCVIMVIEGIVLQEVLKQKETGIDGIQASELTTNE